ncbi:hypothetical protein F5Y11DRAFT_231489 [Daldinia sp. FL1419]|nr:hypothetical protein F5Y11DRAFT_231489 [Daldinia sp. FL1419]
MSTCFSWTRTFFNICLLLSLFLANVLSTLPFVPIPHLCITKPVKYSTSFNSPPPACPSSLDPVHRSVRNAQAASICCMLLVTKDRLRPLISKDSPSTSYGACFA